VVVLRHEQIFKSQQAQQEKGQGMVSKLATLIALAHLTGTMKTVIGM
jgi:hypothetical protein